MSRSLFTKEQEDYVRQNIKGNDNQTLTDMVNKKFCLSITKMQMKNWKKTRRLSSGLTRYFELGGTIGGTRVPNNYEPIGTEKVIKGQGQGYTKVKVSDEGPHSKRWKMKHVLVWESVNGPLPHGCRILFADKDKTNFDIENLLLVTMGELLEMNKRGLIYDHPELTKSGTLVAKVHQKINAKKRKKEKVHG